MLKFSKANTKLEALANHEELSEFLQNKRKIYSLDLLSGWSCPFADQCLSKVHQIDGKRKLIDGKNTKFRCFSASQEVVYTNVYNLRKANYDFLRSLATEQQMVDAIQEYLPKNLGINRFDVGGDFFNEKYFRAVCIVASLNPDRLFYGYTKSLPYWVDNRDMVPYNLVLTASYGGRCDHMIAEHGLRSAKVVLHPEDTDLPIDHDDSHAAKPSLRDQDFALLIHGVQPKDSDASDAIKRLKKENVKFSYSK